MKFVKLDIIKRGVLKFATGTTGWKGNKCHAFNIRLGRLKGPKNLYTIWGLNLILSSRKGVT